MRPECAQVISSAAGRELTKGELNAIEDGILGSLRELARTDKDNFMQMSEAERMTAAAKLAKEKMLDGVVRAHEATIVEAGRKAALFEHLDSFKPGKKGQVHALKNLISSVETKVDGMSASFFAMTRGLQEMDGGKLFGMILDPAKQKDLRAALFGEQSSPEARKVAESLTKMNNAAAEMANREGVPINMREDWRTPQVQDPSKVAGVAKSKWVEDHLNWVDHSQYVNPDGSSMTPDQLRGMLEQSYLSIATDGANKRAVAESIGGSNLMGRNKNAPRQLFFKDSASYGEAMEAYGRSSNIYELMTSHIRGLSKDIVLSKTFGRDADANVQQAMARAYVNDLGAGAGKNSLDSLQSKTQKYYDGIVHPDRPGNEGAANLGVQVRGIISATQLGSLVGAFPDLAGLMMAAHHNGLPAFQVFRNFVDGIASGAEKKQFQHNLGVWQEGFQHASNRMAIEEFKNGWGTFSNELTHRAMGLNAFDRGMRVGMGRTVMDTLGRFTRKFDLLEAADGESRMLKDYGVTQDHWDVWRAAEPDKGRGNETLLSPDSIRNIPDAKLDPLIEQKLAARSDIFRTEIEKRDAQNAKEVSWIAGRVEKIRAAKGRADAFLQELTQRGTQKVGDAAELENVRALVLSNMLRQLEVNHDFLAMHAVEGAHGETVALLNAAQDGAHIEGQVAPATRPGVEGGQRAGKAKPGLEDVASRNLQNYGRTFGEGGEGLGKMQERIAAAIKEGQARIKELEKNLEIDLDSREKVNAERFQERMADLKTFADEVQERASRRQEYIDAYQKKVGKLIGEERNRAKDDALSKLMEVTYGNMQFGARGASRSSIGDRVAMGMGSAADAGTVMGELKRFMVQFKSVPLGIFRAHLEAAGKLDTIGAKTAYLAQFAAYSTLTGALAVELKAIINGQNPRNMNPQTEEGKKFWMESLAAGGGMGLYGDLFANGQTKGGSGAEVLMGPGITAGYNVVKELSTAREEAMSGIPTKHQYSLAGLRWVRKNATPFANIWYAKAAFNRLVYDQMQDTLSPGSSARQQQRMQAKGASYWWAPGTTEPQQAPDLSKAWQDR